MLKLLRVGRGLHSRVVTPASESMFPAENILTQATIELQATNSLKVVMKLSLPLSAHQVPLIASTF
jgi:hypothetical protein